MHKRQRMMMEEEHRMVHFLFWPSPFDSRKQQLRIRVALIDNCSPILQAQYIQHQHVQQVMGVAGVMGQLEQQQHHLQLEVFNPFPTEPGTCVISFANK